MFDAIPAASAATIAFVLVGLWLVPYALSVLWWVFEVLVLARGWHTDETDREWGLEDVQVRVLTIDAERVVQGTVDTVPDAVDDVRVIAERPIAVDGARVHVVPDSFECTATNKGRALEWASRTLQCDREYVLYLDEDTLVTDFTGLPDADIVQFTERPIYTGSWLAYCCEVFRVGYQFEQYAFHRLRYPLYTWGGGVAVRNDLENRIGWDVETITEDTNFVWRAARKHGLTFRLVDARFRNQAPPSLRAMFGQRRRWISGSVRDGTILPRSYRPLYATRIYAWACSPLVPIAFLGSVATPGVGGASHLLGTVSALLGVVLIGYTCCGLRAYRARPLLWPVLILATPVAVVLHAVGAMWGVLSPVTTFDVTEKVDPDAIEAINPGLEDGDIETHDGTERLLEDESGDEPLTWPLVDD
ncbi:glycosyltransferase family 2 protein [Halopiger djelfimassiliensis]|uniref:glycosyltransferase family 2 protein n=1 Tax=Halopiger djelfimassiliensis TaxID=1293047 RepID=UPI000AC50A56|nr:glycosyltransferase family 2 protein [Halopiger djelfimassiliensis]